MTTMSTPLLVTFLVYIFGMVLIGLMAYRATNNFGDYILGGRRMGSVVTALSAGASDMSGWLLMGLPGAVFLSGISESWIAIGLTIGAYLNWTWVAGRLRVHTEINHNALTLPDYFSHRFEDKSKLLRVISALVILVFFTIYCASGIVAGARLFESTFGMSYDTALWAGAAATIAYTFIGGYLAVSWTDTVQASLMIFALILTPVIVILSVGGITPSLAVIEAKSPANLDMFKGLDTIAILSLLGWGLGYFGQPHILARFMAADSHHTIRNARRISMTWMVLCLAGAVTVGFFGIAYFTGNPTQAGNVSQNGERVFIELARLLFNPWIAGVLLSAILAGGDEYAELPVTGLLQRHHRRFVQTVSAQKRQPERAGVGRPHHGVTGVGGGDCTGGEPRKPGIGAGQLRLGRLRRGVRSGDSDFPAVAAHDPQWRAGRHDGWRRHGDHLETVRLAESV